MSGNQWLIDNAGDGAREQAVDAVSGSILLDDPAAGRRIRDGKTWETAGIEEIRRAFDPQADRQGTVVQMR